MVETDLKRKISEHQNDPSEGRMKKARKKMIVHEDTDRVECSEDVVKEFIKLTRVKQTRMKGLKQFLMTIKNAAEKREIILKYLQSRPDCSEMFEVLNENPEQRSLFEVQVVVEILEMIILQLVEDDMRTKSQAAVIVSRFLTNHRKLVYNCLNSASPAGVTMAVLKLLTAIVMHGPTLARELLTAFDFSHKTFGALVNRRDKKDVIDVRTCFIKFVLSFFVTGDPPLIQQVLQVKGFATSILKNLSKDSAEVIHLTLSTLLTKIVQNRSILKKTKILLFTSYSLSQLAKLYSCEDDSDSTIRGRIHHFLLELCTSQNGIAFGNKLGIFSVGSNNPVLLRFLHSLPKTLDDDLLIELIIKTLLNSQDLVSPYLSGNQMALEPRNSQQWLNNITFVIKLYFHLPMPKSIFKNPSICPDLVSSSRFLSLVCPENAKRNVLTRGLQHSDAVVQGTTLSLMMLILRRSCNMIISTSIDGTILTSFREDVLKLLPSFQILITIRENLSNRTMEARDLVDESKKDLPPQLSIKDASILLSRTLTCISLFQTLSPNCFVQSNYDPWKLLPRNSEEEPFYNLSSKHSMLQIFLSCPSRNFKWNSQSKTDNSVYFRQVLQLYCHEKDSNIQAMARELLDKFLTETGVCKGRKDEVSIWLNNMLDDCINDRGVVIQFFEKVYCRLASDPFDLVDDVIESVQAITVTSQSYLTKDADKRSLPFTPVVPCSLKSFTSFVKDIEEQNDKAENLNILAWFLNLVILDILELQTDPRLLCNMIAKILTQDVTSVPVHTRLMLDYVTHWSTDVNVDNLGIIEDDERKLPKKFKHLQKKEKEKQMLTLPPKQFKRQLFFLIQSGQTLDLQFVVNYLKCNPAYLFDSEILKILNGLPCFLIIRQLLMFVLKYWKSGTEIADNTALWDTFKTFVDGILLTAKRESVESWERTVSAILCLATNVIGLYLENPGNQLVFLEILKTVTDILKIVFDQVQEISASCDKLDMDVGNDVINDVTNNDVIANNHTNSDVTNNDGTSNDVIDNGDTNDGVTSDVISALDETCERSQDTIPDERDVLPRFMKMVFEHDLFRNMFHHFAVKTEKDNSGLNYASKIISDCIAELMRHLHEEILQDKNNEYLEPYFHRVAQTVKEEAIGAQDIDVILPYNVPATVLLKIFHKYFPARILSEILEKYLASPREQFLEMRESHADEIVLNRNGETFIQVVECFLAREDFDDSMPPEVSEGVLSLLMSMNCQKSDEIIANFISRISELSDPVLSAVLHHSLSHATAVHIETAALVMCQRPVLRTQLEDWVLAQVDGKSTSIDKAKFLEGSEWETFLPLLLFYLSTAGSELNAEQSEKCLKYICEVTWLRLREWLLEMKYVAKSNDCLKILCLLLEIDRNDFDFVQNIFTDAVVKEYFVKLNMYQIEAIERILQYILNNSSKDKVQKKFRTIFVFSCMERLTGSMKNKKGDDSLRLKILHYLEIYGQSSLRFKKIETFSVQEFVSITNTFLKSSLRFCFTCSQTLRVLSILIKTVYQNCTNKLLLPLTDLYQFILNHSKFLEIFLGKKDSSGGDHATKEAVVGLLQTVVDLESKCCEPSHFYFILGAYSATLSLSDQKLLRLLFTYETNLDHLALGSRVLWGEAAIEAYEAEKNGPTTLWHEPNITQILDLLDTKLLLQSAKHFPQHKPLQPVNCEDFGADSQFYDPSFVLPIFSFFLAPSCEVNCRRFIDSSALAYTISALTSAHKEIRQIAYQILSRFQNHLTTARFREKQQVAHLLHYFQNGITEADCRVSSLITSFIVRALHIFFYPEDPLYPSVNSYMLQKAFMDLRDVPLFLSLLNNSDLMYRTERTWLLHLILDGLRDPMDYYICKKFHVFQQLFTLYNSAIADKSLQNLILKIVHAVCRHHAAVFDLCQNYGLMPWLHLLITSNISENFLPIVDILTALWFTLIGQSKSRDEHTTTQRVTLPRNVCSELLLVLLSVLQTSSSELWSEEIFVSFTDLLASLLDHQDRWTTSAKVIFTKEHLKQIARTWQHLFGTTDIYSKLQVVIKAHTGFSESQNKFTSEKWFLCLKHVLDILATSDIMEGRVENEDRVDMYLGLCGRPDAMYFNLFLQRKLRCALQTFMNISDSTFLHNGNEGQKLMFLRKIVF